MADKVTPTNGRNLAWMASDRRLYNRPGSTFITAEVHQEIFEIRLDEPCDTCSGVGLKANVFSQQFHLCPICSGSGIALTEDGKKLVNFVADHFGLERAIYHQPKESVS